MGKFPKNKINKNTLNKLSNDLGTLVPSLDFLPWGVRTRRACMQCQSPSCPPSFPWSHKLLGVG